MEPVSDDRIIGAVLGLAVGDALGAPLEGAKPGAIRNAFKTVADYVDSEELFGREKVYKWRKPGLYTDDTQQALALLESVVRDRGLNPERAAERLASLARGAEFHFGVYRGAGKNFRLSAADLRQGKSWMDSGRDTAGNGAAARIAPVAAYYSKNLDEMADKAADVSIITHRNPVGISAATAVAFLVARCLAMDELPREGRAQLLLEAADFCRRKETACVERYGYLFFEGYKKTLHLFSGTLRGLAGVQDGPTAKAGKWIAENAAPHASSAVTRPTLGFAPASVAFAIHLALSNSGSYRDAVVAAINEGGDADTVAAIAGAISGALHGASAIPENWLKGLANRKQLKARAEALAARKWNSALEDLYEMEYGLTRREHDERLARMKKLGVDFPEKRKTEKMSEPRPVEEKFDRKKSRRDLRRLKQWERFAPRGFD
jgi:ADP-ribosyl-[dinitrogen reductase] hydrolase